MIVGDRKMDSPNRYRSVSRTGAGPTLLLMAALTGGIAVAQDITRNTHLSDSNSERAPLVTVFPKYPYVARRDRIEGEAVVCFSISSKGRVVRPSVRRSSHRIFNKPSVRAMKSSSFEPLLPGETLSVVKTCRTFRFKLDPVLADNS